MRLRLSGSQRSGPSLLGIDLRPGHARLMACTRAQRRWRVERCAERAWALERGAEGPLQQFDALSRALRDLVQEAGAGLRVALSLPEQAVQRQVLAVPPELRPWGWRAWLREQAERLGGAPAQGLAIDVQLLHKQPLRVLLSVCPQEVLEDWKGLAEAAGVELVAVEDRVRAMRLALQALGLVPPGDAFCALAEASADTCWLHVWHPGQAVQSQEVSVDPGQAGAIGLPAGGWLVGSASDAAQWASRLALDAPDRWPVPDLTGRLQWAEQVTPPSDCACYLTALGLALRAWTPA